MTLSPEDKDPPDPVVVLPQPLSDRGERTQELRLTDAFLSRYVLRGILGSGGCAKVYRALDRKLRRDVAVKLLVRHGDDAQVERFMQEAKLLGRITDPNVVTVFDLELVDGHPCMVMELMEGGSLRHRLVNEGGLPVDVALKLMLMALSGLAACHAAGVVHRDLKPENLLTTRDDMVKIADLGVARYTDALTRLTAIGEIVGTPRYMAPEQISSHEATVESDLHAMGVILFELISGSKAYAAPQLPDLLHQLVGPHVPDLALAAPHAPDPVVALVRRAMCKDPAQRFHSAAEMAADIRSCVSGVSAPELDVAPRSGGALRHVPRAGERTLGAPRPSGETQVLAPPVGAPPVGAPLEPRKRPDVPIFFLAALLVVLGLWVRPSPAPPVAEPASPSSASSAPASAPDPSAELSDWQEEELWAVHAELERLAGTQEARRRDWLVLHDLITPTTWELQKGVAVLEKLRADTDRDIQDLARAHTRLRARRSGDSAGPLEQALRTRVQAQQFNTTAVRERLDHYMKELPKDGMLDFDALTRLDQYAFSPPVRGTFAGCCRDLPRSLVAAAGARAAARDLLPALLLDLTRVTQWLHSAGRGGQSSPEIVAARAALRRELDADHPDELTRRVLLVAQAAVLWGESGAGTRASREMTRHAADQLEALGRALPRARARLDAYAALLGSVLTPYESPAPVRPHGPR